MMFSIFTLWQNSSTCVQATQVFGICDYCNFRSPSTHCAGVTIVILNRSAGAVPLRIVVHHSQHQLLHGVQHLHAAAEQQHLRAEFKDQSPLNGHGSRVVQTPCFRRKA